jgi:hypothetical protein
MFAAIVLSSYRRNFSARIPKQSIFPAYLLSPLLLSSFQTVKAADGMRVARLWRKHLNRRENHQDCSFDGVVTRFRATRVECRSRCSARLTRADSV